MICAAGAVGLFDGGAQAHLGRGLVHQVDGLVGQAAVLDIPLAQSHRGLQRLLADAQLVVLLVTLLQAFQDLQGLLGRRLVDVDGREAALERGVLFDALAIFVMGGGADQPQLTASQGRLEQVRAIERALGIARRRPACAARRGTG